MAHEKHTLITPKQALEIITWVSASGLYIGSRGTNRLTKFPVEGSWLYSKEECEALRDEIIQKGIAYATKMHAQDLALEVLI